jgi:KAP family P-loop domain
LKKSQSDDPNRHIREYLNHYIGFAHPPGFAVMLSGPWGIGKTFLLRKILDGKFQAPKKYVYVSLYGLSKTEEIEEALFAALYPWQATKGAKIIGGIARTAFKYFKVQPELVKADILDKLSADLYVFDDLERCEMPVAKALGYINEFVEHDGCKVIIIANENEIKDPEPFRQRKEKLVGKTLEVQSSFDEALAHFITKIGDAPTKAFFETQTQSIKSVYDQSELHNLRILQQTMWDFERVYPLLTDEHRSNSAAMAVLFKLFFALSFELKSGRIDANDLHNRNNRFAGIVSTDLKAPSPFEIASKRYPKIQLNALIFSDDLLGNLLVRGIVDKDKIVSELNASSWFVTEANEPSWRTVWYAFQRRDDDVAKAISDMKKKMAAHEYSEPGIILHVFGIRLWLSRIGASKISLEKTVARAKTYINKLRTQRKLPFAVPIHLDDLRHQSGYGGLGFYESSTSEFAEIFKYLQNAKQLAAEDRYESQAVGLLQELKTNPSGFAQKISEPNDSSESYLRIPILSRSDPKKFAEVLLALEPMDFNEALRAIWARYRNASLQSELASERDWIAGLHSILLAAAAKMAPIGRARVTQITNQALSEYLKKD